MKPTFLSMASVLLATFFLRSPTFGDTIVLTNGNKIDGTVITDERASGGKLVLGVAGGTMFFRASEVASIETTEAAPPAAPAGNFVEVRLSTGNTFYGSGSYFGIVSPQSTDETLVLVIPDVGTIKIPRSAVASIEEIEGDPTQPVARNVVQPSEITTTNAIYMKNGRKLIGTVIPTPETEPVKIRIGHLGVVTVPRKNIDRIADETSTITLPAEEAPAETTTEPEPATSPLPDSVETLKGQIKAELLRELLQELLDVKVGVLLEGAAAPEQLMTTRMTLFGEEEIPVQELLRELTRNRTENRTRAESRLAAMGPAVLPHVESLVHHPFDLTRRAVQRIARDVDSWNSVPIAIEGLNDPDQFVREIAHNTLEGLLPDAGVDYGPNASRQARAAAQAAYWGIWDEELLRDARRGVLDRLARVAATPSDSPSSAFSTDWRSAPPPLPAGSWRAVPLIAPAARESTSPSAGDWRPVPLISHGVR